MSSTRAEVLGLTVIGSLLGAVITTTRKYLLDRFSVVTILALDSLITTTMVMLVSLGWWGTGQLYKELMNLDGSAVAAFLGSSAAVTVSILIGKYLLKNTELTHLVLIETAVEVLVTLLVAALVFGEQMTIRTGLGLACVLLGTYIIHTGLKTTP